MRNSFRVTGGKGFQITFPNGYTISVQFGPGNYGQHYDRRIGHDELRCGEEGSDTAETAIIDPAGNLIHDPVDTDEYVGSVQGYQTIEQVWDRMQRVAAFSGTSAAASPQGSKE